jgi:hypothetical protein
MAGIANIETSKELDSIIKQIVSGQVSNEIPKSGYYVYVIYNNSNKEILYIGKGKGNRVKNHFGTQKTRTAYEINKLKDSGQDVFYMIAQCFENEKEAYKFESILIQQALYQEIELINISQTHKDVYLKSYCYEAVSFLDRLIRAGYHPPHPEFPEVLKCDMMNKILESLQNEAIKVPKISEGLYLFSHRILDIVKLEQIPHKTIIQLTNGTQTEYAF